MGCDGYGTPRSPGALLSINSDVSTFEFGRFELREATCELFRDGKRPATIMHQIAKGYTDQQFEQLADFFARQAK